MASFPHRHLLGIESLSKDDVLFLLDEAEGWIGFNRGRRKQDDRLSGLTQINCFFENSTRTLLSFEIAGKRLGAQVVNMAVQQSSVKKGESLIDTMRTIDAMQPDAIVVRHDQSGSAAQIAEAVSCPVINAGDGSNEHPTQALLDAITMRRRKGRLEGLKVAICGDILHSRVARSNLLLLAMMGAEVRVVGPPSLLPEAEALNGASAHTDLDEGIAGADVVMMLRIQRERMQAAVAGSLDDFHNRYGLTWDRLRYAAPDALIMHPGPMNRGVEIESSVADHSERSAILEQVEIGVAVRMACLDVLTREGRQG
ncbi:MAG TPA: aspartate carbamoyltransferase catalytic subunit [Allosphingosinicella sp.]|nr:aspartate carbamoyltransferase catalytic subunit [Allosphingosinicella sp.]